MKTKELYTYIKVSEEVIADKKQTLYEQIKSIAMKVASDFRLNCAQINTILKFLEIHKVDVLYLYDLIKSYSEEDSLFKKLWIAKDNEYIVEPTEIPIGYFSSIINILD